MEKIGSPTANLSPTVLLSDIIDCVSDAIIQTDLAFIITGWNKAAQNIYGYSAAEAIGKPMPELISTSYLNVTKEKVLEVFCRESRWCGQVVQRHKDGHDVQIEASVTLIKSDAGEPQSVIAINRPCGERLQAEMTEKFENTLNSLRQLAGAVAHEFSQPLNIISLSVGFLKELHGESVYTEKALEAVRRSAELIEHLQNIVSIEKRPYLKEQILDLKASSNGLNSAK